MRPLNAPQSTLIPMPPLAVDDLEHVLSHTREVWEDLRGARIFLTGGTGFFGVWLCETFAHAVARLKLDTQLMVLTRDVDRFHAKMPHLVACSSIGWQRGDVRDFEFPTGNFTHVIHAATPASADLNQNAPLEMFDTIVGGTHRVLDFAAQSRASRFLLTSSGAVYGRQPPEISHVAEDYAGAPAWNESNAAYGQGKRAAEWLCSVYQNQCGLEPVIARGWAFVGPHLPLEVHFAIGNFIRDGLQSTSIRVGGDGTPLRSYLYASDLAIWLWTMLVRAQAGRAYNVGSPEAHSIADIARAVADVCNQLGFEPKRQVSIAPTGVPSQPASRYLPCVQRAQQELGLQPTVGLEEAIRRTLVWHRHQAASRGES